MTDTVAKLSDRLEALMADLEREHPDQGFLIVSVGEHHGVQRIATYSNMEDETVSTLASILIQADEELDELDTPRKDIRQKLH